MPDPEMQRMQQEAIRRVQEMQSRARAAVQSDSNGEPAARESNFRNGGPHSPGSRPAGEETIFPPFVRPLGRSSPGNRPSPARGTETAKTPPRTEGTPGPEPSAPPFSQQREQQEPAGSPQKESGGLPDLFSSLFQDSDPTLILILLLLLMEEKNDTSLVFALMYLLL